MTPTDLTNYYGNSYQFKKKTKLSDASFRNWQKWGFIPEASQYKIERLSNGELKTEWTRADYNTTFTPQQMDFICYQIGEWYLNWELKITERGNTHKLGVAKEELKDMICGVINKD